MIFAIFSQKFASAARALLGNKVRSALTMLGISIGVFSVTLLVSVGEGTQTFVENTLAGIGTNLVSIVPGRVETQNLGYLGGAVERPLLLEDADVLARDASHLSAVSPVVLGSVNVQRSGRKRSTTLFGVGGAFLRIRQLSLEAGSFFPNEALPARRRLVVLGKTVATTLFGAHNPVGSSVNIGNERFLVIGVLSRKGRSLGIDLDDLAIVPTTVAQELFAQKSLTQILAVARAGADLESAKQQVTDILARTRRGERSFTIQTQDDLLRVFHVITSALSLTLLAISCISLFVGGIGVMNIMLVSVRERTREIGVRRALGATRRDILLQFLVESILVALLGGAIGLFVGALCAGAVSLFAPDVPMRLSLKTALLACASSLVVGAASGVVPARLAARMDPAQALRFE